jgi:hypothetical protein
MVPFSDLKAQYATIKNEVDAAVLSVIGSADFVLKHAAELQHD